MARPFQYGEPTVNRTIRLPESLVEKIKQSAFRHSVTVSEVVLRMLSQSNPDDAAESVAALKRVAK